MCVHPWAEYPGTAFSLLISMACRARLWVRVRVWVRVRGMVLSDWAPVMDSCEHGQ